MLKTLEAFNDDRRAIYELGQAKTRPNGIECPHCGEELLDSDQSTTLTSNPPQKHIHCPRCKYHGLRLA